MDVPFCVLPQRPTPSPFSGKAFLLHHHHYKTAKILCYFLVWPFPIWTCLLSKYRNGPILHPTPDGTRMALAQGSIMSPETPRLWKSLSPEVCITSTKQAFQHAVAVRMWLDARRISLLYIILSFSHLWVQKSAFPLRLKREAEIS